MVVAARSARRVAHHIADGIGRGERPERVVGWELPGPEVEAVDVFASEPLPPTVNRGCPIGRFLKNVDDRQSLLHGGAYQKSVAGLTSLPNGTPTVDGPRLRLRHRVQDQDGCQERQRGAHDRALYDTRTSYPR